MPPWAWVEVASDLWMRDPGHSEPHWGDVQGTHSPVHLPVPTPGCSAPSPKVYKLLYASRLADHGLPAQALQYCELVAAALLCHDPATHPVLARQVVRVSLHLLHPNLGVIPAQELLG